MIGDGGTLLEDRPMAPLKTLSFTPNSRYQIHGGRTVGDENCLNPEVILKVLHKYYLESENHRNGGVGS